MKKKASIKSFKKIEKNNVEPNDDYLDLSLDRCHNKAQIDKIEIRGPKRYSSMDKVIDSISSKKRSSVLLNLTHGFIKKRQKTINHKLQKKSNSQYYACEDKVCKGETSSVALTINHSIESVVSSSDSSKTAEKAPNFEPEKDWLFNVGPDKHIKSYNISSQLSSKNKWDIRDFIIGSVLGRGKFGCVYKAQEILPNGRSSKVNLALKVVTKSKLLSYKDGQLLLRREIEVQSSLEHENILQILGYFHDHASVFLVLEEASGGEFYRNKIAKAKRKRLKENVAANYIHQVACALSYLQSKTISHRDIKPENLLLDSGNKIKLCDFGWAVNYHDKNLRSTLCGTPEYVPPEMISPLISAYEAKYVDIWALGVLTYEFIVGKTMFYTPDGTNGNIGQEKIFSKIESFKLELFDWSRLGTNNEILRDFLFGLMRRDPKQRFEMAEVLDHFWFRKHRVLTQS